MPFDNSKNYKKVIRFADDETKNKLDSCLNKINARIQQNAKKLLEIAVNRYDDKQVEFVAIVQAIISAIISIIFSCIVSRGFLESLSLSFAFVVGAFIQYFLISCSKNFFKDFRIKNQKYRERFENMTDQERLKEYKKLGIIDENGNPIDS